MENRVMQTVQLVIRQIVDNLKIDDITEFAKELSKKAIKSKKFDGLDSKR
ncbi:hypothetical protein OH492_14510 [Vibrio chagasii]|nr:hypothetical protein [Vibrio chagasii]